MISQIINSFIGASLILISTAFLPVDFSTNNHKTKIPFFRIAMAEENFENILKSVKNKLALDTRVTLFDVKVTQNESGIVLSGKVLEQKQKDEIINAFKNIGKIQDNIEIFPFKNIGELSYGVANLPLMNIREFPKHSSQLISQSLLGVGMKILDNDNEWLKVQIDDDGYIGWVKQTDVWRLNKNDYQYSW